MRPACPKKNCIDGIAGRLYADKRAADFHIIRADFLLDHVQCFQRYQFRSFNASPSWRAQTQLELARVHRGKKFRSKTRQQSPDQQACTSKIESNHWPAQFQNQIKVRCIGAMQQPLFIHRRSLAQQPCGQHRNQCAGKYIGTDHGSSYGQCQWNKQLPAHAHHKEAWEEHGQNGQHCKQSSGCGFAAGFQHASCAACATG